MLATVFLGGCVNSLLRDSDPAQLGPLDYLDWVRMAEPAAIVQERQRLQLLLDDGIATIPSLQLSMLLGVDSDLSDATLSEAMARAEIGAVTCGLSMQCQDYKQFRQVWYENLQQRQQLGTVVAAMQESQQQIDTLNDVVRQLRQQIEELTLIEQDIVEREQPLRQQ